VPEIVSGELEIVAIARRPGELSKAAVRRRLRLQPHTPRPVPLVLGRAGERIRAIKRELPATERVDIGPPAKVQHRLRQELAVNVLRLDPDQGTIIVSERVPTGRQLRLPLT
jgi:transcription antitermination factor NusA-like protein